jgi:hypothetical protein
MATIPKPGAWVSDLYHKVDRPSVALNQPLAAN